MVGYRGQTTHQPKTKMTPERWEDMFKRYALNKDESVGDLCKFYEVSRTLFYRKLKIHLAKLAEEEGKAPASDKADGAGTTPDKSDAPAGEDTSKRGAA